MTTSVEIAVTDVGNDARVMLAEWRARRRIGAVRDEGDVLAFCRRLRGYTYQSRRSADGWDTSPLPPGYDNVRIFDAYDGFLLGSQWRLGPDGAVARAGPVFHVSAKRVAAMSVIGICLNQPLEDVTAWRSTAHVSPATTGTLDLMVDIDFRPRRSIWDGTALPDHLVAFAAARARRRA